MQLEMNVDPKKSKSCSVFVSQLMHQFMKSCFLVSAWCPLGVRLTDETAAVKVRTRKQRLLPILKRPRVADHPHNQQSHSLDTSSNLIINLSNQAPKTET